MGNVMELVEAPHQKVTLSLEAEVMRQLDELVKEVASWPATQEFGVRVTREVAARVALLRGLQTLNKSPTPPKTSPVAVAESDEDIDVVEPPTVDPDITRHADGTIQRPDGWQEWQSRDGLPNHQDLLHTYYTAHGWKRMWGKVGQDVITFYWSDNEQEQSLTPFVGGEQELMLQETPWGPGHIVPKGWMPKEE